MSATIITGERVRIFQAMVLLKAMDLWIEKGIKVNSAYTPKNMRAKAEAIVGRPASTLKIARGYLKNWIDANG